MIETQVLIAGGGPVGLTLAVALARLGVGSILADPGAITPVDLPQDAAPFTLQEVHAEPHVTLRSGWRLFGFERFADGVTAHLEEVAGEGQQQVRARFLIGCDGADSLVRNFLDIDLENQLARTFGRGRVILAGDAAHPMAPGSHDGLMLGVGDALRLAQGLAECATGSGDMASLQSYELERRLAVCRCRSGV